MLTYLLIGAFSLLAVGLYARKRKVKAEVESSLFNPPELLFVLLLWPVFVINDLFCEIPKRIKEKGMKRIHSDETEFL